MFMLQPSKRLFKDEVQKISSDEYLNTLKPMEPGLGDLHFLEGLHAYRIIVVTSVFQKKSRTG